MNAIHERTLTEICNRISAEVPVKWDRLTDDTGDGGDVKVYGWIEHNCDQCTGTGEDRSITHPDDPPYPCARCSGTGKDRRANFVLVMMDEVWIRTITSSSEHSKAIYKAAFPASSGDAHVDCQRVEDVLPGVEAAIKLEPKA